ncbi:MFS family permease [Paenibacillus shirakamiensis]|uniref:MFS family permease n=1 Tax=Paenibacillus shirakamiensis TaxID=1265935 RepID=A0ABS4JB97_9BACL|nr:MFS transporter [Paenibacillus shirakamiensis]MBP1998983.1 MFS family permease [Paenibacillus shirakamiensis]
MNNGKIILRFLRNARNIRLLALAIFISNIGSGMQLIAVSKLLYDKTNSATSIGIVIILQYVVMFLVQFISGTVVDRSDQKKILVISDFTKGVFITGAGTIFLIHPDTGLSYLFIILIIVNFVVPFFSNAQFTLTPELVRDKDELLQANSIITTLFQAGQLLGSAIVASIIFFMSPATALIISGCMFFISAFYFKLIKYSKQIKEVNEQKSTGVRFFEDWKYLMQQIGKEKSVLAHLLMSSGDYMAVNIFNLMLIPLVAVHYNNNSFYISLFDSGFAIGSMIIVALIASFSKKLGTNNSAVVGLFLQSMILIILSIKIHVIFAFLLIIVYGSANSFSITIFNTNLQKRSTSEFMGRINSVKNFIVSVLTITLIPILSRMFDISIEYGLLASGVVLFSYSFISYLLGRKFVFGSDYLSKGIILKKSKNISLGD